MRHRKKDPGVMGALMGEGRLRILVTLAGLVVILAAVAFGVFLIPDRVSVLLYDPSPGEVEAMDALCREFRLKTGQSVEVRTVDGGLSLDVLLGRGDPSRLVAFPEASETVDIQEYFDPLPDEGDLRSRDPSLISSLKVPALVLARDPVVMYQATEAFRMRGMLPAQTLEQLAMRYRQYGNAWPRGIDLAGGNDRDMAQFLSAMVISVFGPGAYHQLVTLTGEGRSWEEIFTAPLSTAPLPLAGTGMLPPERSLSGLVDMLADWTGSGIMEAGWHRRTRGELAETTGLFQTATLFASLSFREELLASGARRYRLMPFPALSSQSATGASCAPGWLLGMRKVDPSRQSPALERLARDFLSFCASREGREVLARTTGLQVPGIPSEFPRQPGEDPLFTALPAGPWLPGLAREGYRSFGRSVWKSDLDTATFCARVRDAMDARLEARGTDTE